MSSKLRIARCLSQSLYGPIMCAALMFPWFSLGVSAHAQDWHAFLWTPADGMHDLGVLPGYSGSSATAINDAGQVVGFCGQEWPQTSELFLWDPVAGMIGLGSIPGFPRMQVSSINRDGIVAGAAWRTDGGDSRAFTWDSTNGIKLLPSLPPNGATSTWDFGRSINALGQVAGTSGGGHAVVWQTDGSITDIGLGDAMAINESGTVVGCFSIAGVYHWATWSPSAGFTELDWPELDWPENRIMNVWDINRCGQVVGWRITPETGIFYDPETGWRDVGITGGSIHFTLFTRPRSGHVPPESN